MFTFGTNETSFTFDGSNYLHSSFSPDWVKSVFGIEPKVIFEFGAYDGGDSIRYKQQYPNAEVYTFEAHPDLFKRVKEIEKYGIKTFNYAISDTIGTLDFYPTQNVFNLSADCAGSLLKATEKTIKTNTQFNYLAPIKVPSITIKQFCLEHSITSIDFMHVDVEGVADRVLVGCGDILPKLLFVELASVENTYIGAANTRFTREFLNSKGYEHVGTNNADDIFKLKEIK